MFGTVTATLAAQVLDAPQVLDRFGALPAGRPMPSLPACDWASLRAGFPFAVAFTLLGAIESLLSEMVADQMSGSRMRHDDELIGQGIANVVAGLFDRFCTTGTIVRTTANVKAGSRRSGIWHDPCGPVAGVSGSGRAACWYDTVGGIGRMLMLVARKMIEWHAIASLINIDRAEAGVMAATFLGVILDDLTTGQS